MNLNEQFQAAADRVNNLPPDAAAAHMTELYGLYKQATEGDHDTKGEAVGDDSPDNPSGPAGMSQAQWDSWSQFKGVPEEEAKRRYVQRVAELGGHEGGNGRQAGSVSTDEQTNAPVAGHPSQVAPGENTTPAQQPNSGPGQSTAGGLRGDITAGAPYGGEDMLKGQQ